MKKLLIALLALSLFLASCGNSSDYVASVGKQKISVPEIEFYLQSVKGQMAGTELASEEDWQTTEIEGKKAIDIAKEKALDEAINNLLYIEVAKSIGVKLTDDDKKLLSQNKTNFINQFGSKDAYKKFLSSNNITDNFIDTLSQSALYKKKLSDKVNEEKNIADEEIALYFNEHKEDLNLEYRKAKHILILTRNMETGEDLSPEEQEAAKVEAEEILNKARSGENFDELAKNFTDDPGLESNPDGYVFTDGEMLIDFQNGVDALVPGELGLVKSEIGYHVLLRLPLDIDDIREKLKTTLQDKNLTSQLELWKNENNISIEIYNEMLEKI